MNGHIYEVYFYNRGIKTQRTIKTKLLVQIMDSLIIMIGQLGIIQLINRKIGRKDVNKQIVENLSTKYP